MTSWRLDEMILNNFRNRLQFDLISLLVNFLYELHAANSDQIWLHGGLTNDFEQWLSRLQLYLMLFVNNLMLQQRFHNI